MTESRRRFMLTRRLLRHLLLLSAYGTLGTVITLLVVYGIHLSKLPELQPWHTARLDAEFTRDDADTVKTLEDYRKLEDRLFAQLRTEVYERIPPAERRVVNRYSEGSLSDALKHPDHRNRSFELPGADPRGAVLLLHGLTDSPYSLNGIGERLHAKGWHVVGLRLPGHGTAPSGLLRVDWRDMAEAVRMAVRDLRRRIPRDRPIVLLGYSTGAALAVEYVLARRQGEDLPAVDRLVLISPAIGVSDAAGFAVWQGRISVWLGKPKVAWTEIGPEYDPYKYTSFSVNAADQVYNITAAIQSELQSINPDGLVDGLPPILAFQSVADDTVSTPAVVNTLFRRLAQEHHELVLFDINRDAEIAALLKPGAGQVRADLLEGPPVPFTLTMITNVDAQSSDVVALRRLAGSREVSTLPTGMSWPRGVFSLSHVALPFAPDDAIYGAVHPENSKLIYLGRIEVLGERGLLAVSPAGLIRLRHNPFFDYMQGRIEDFLATR